MTGGEGGGHSESGATKSYTRGRSAYIPDRLSLGRRDKVTFTCQGQILQHSC